MTFGRSPVSSSPLAAHRLTLFILHTLLLVHHLPSATLTRGFHSSPRCLGFRSLHPLEYTDLQHISCTRAPPSRLAIIGPRICHRKPPPNPSSVQLRSNERSLLRPPPHAQLPTPWATPSSVLAPLELLHMTAIQAWTPTRPLQGPSTSPTDPQTLNSPRRRLLNPKIHMQRRASLRLSARGAQCSCRWTQLSRPPMSALHTALRRRTARPSPRHHCLLQNFPPERGHHLSSAMPPYLPHTTKIMPEPKTRPHLLHLPRS